MEPNYQMAARKATETMSKFGSNILTILKHLPDVSVIALDIPSIPGQELWDAFSCVREKNGIIQYIVFYNQALTHPKQTFALARELAHVVLKHGADSPEEIWTEESACFAYHCVGYQPKRKKTINFRPKHGSLLWELKSIQSFDSVEHMKTYIADEQTRFARAISNSGRQYSPDDVELQAQPDYDHFIGWKNCCNIVLDGKTVGYCGE